MPETRWYDIYNHSARLKDVSTDDDGHNGELVKFFDDVKYKLDSGDTSEFPERTYLFWHDGEVEEREYISDLRRKYEEFSYQFDLEPVHVAVYAVNIVGGIFSLLFRALKLTAENMSRNTDVAYAGSDRDYPDYDNDNYENDKGMEKRKAREKDKGDRAKNRASRKKRGDNNERDLRSSEKAQRQRRAAEIGRENAAVENYNRRVRIRAQEKRANEMEMSSERSLGR